MQLPSWPESDEREVELLRAVLRHPQWGGFHPFVSEFEQRFADYQQCAFGVSTFNGTVSLELALTVLDVQPGDEVIVPAISFISTATAVSRSGAIPVFVDIGETTFNIDPASAADAISPRTKGMIAVHFGGSMCDMARLRAVCRDHNIWMLEDAAHAHGSEWSGRRSGSFGVSGSFSFQNGKALTAGEGGMVVTSDPSFAERARSFANQGRTIGRSFYEHDRLGTNFRMTAWQAAVLLAQLERLDEQIEQRSRSAALLTAAVGEAQGIHWQSAPAEANRNSFYLLPGWVEGGRAVRDQLIADLNAAEIPCTPFYPHTLYRNGAYAQAGSCRVLPCPQAEARVCDAFWLSHRILRTCNHDLEQLIEMMIRLRSVSKTNA